MHEPARRGCDVQATLAPVGLLRAVICTTRGLTASGLHSPQLEFKCELLRLPSRWAAARTYSTHGHHLGVSACGKGKEMECKRAVTLNDAVWWSARDAMSTYPAGGANEVLLGWGRLPPPPPQPPWNGSIGFCVLRHAPPRAPVITRAARIERRALFFQATLGAAPGWPCTR